MNKIKVHISNGTCGERPSKKEFTALRENALCVESEMSMEAFAVEVCENGKAFIVCIRGLKPSP